MRVEFEGFGGVTLVGDGLGQAGAPPVLLLHGGGQTRYSWGDTGRALAEAGFRAISLDARGHGESAWAGKGNYMLEDFAGDLRAVIATLDRKPAVVGASLGGLTALLAQAERPADLLSALVVVDVAPRLEPEGVTRILEFMYSYAEDGFASLEEAADAIAAYMPHRPRPKDLSGLQKNLRLGEDGRYRWHWDPDYLRRKRGEDPDITYDRLAAAARAVVVPTLLVRGRMSDVLSEEAAADFRELVPHAEYVDVADAAHMIAGDDNDAFTEAVVEFLTRTL